MTGKDIQITTTAILKSVIESGAEPDTWEARTRDGLKVWTRIVKNWTDARQSDTNTPAVRNGTRRSTIG